MIRRVLFGVVTLAALAASIQAAGVSNGTLDATTLGNWRTAAPDDDSMYGTDGYIMLYYSQAIQQGYLHTANPSYNPATQDLALLPGYVSGYDVTMYAGADGGTDGAGTTGTLQDPTTLLPIAASHLYGHPNSGLPNVVVEFTMAADRQFVLMLNSHYYAAIPWVDNYVVTGSLGGSGVASGVPTGAGEWWAFDVTATAGEVITVTAAQQGTDGALLSAIAFDPVPEPATMSLLAIGGALAILRRKR